MIVIINVDSGAELFLANCQSLQMQSVERALVHDYNTLRVQSYGPKLAPLVLQGFLSLAEDNEGKTAYQHHKEIQEFFKENPEKKRLSQFVIAELNTEDSIKPIGDHLKFRGVLDFIKLNMNVEMPTLFNYHIQFSCYPFNNISDSKLAGVYYVRDA